MWEIPVRKWAESANIKDQTDNDIPKEKDDIHLPEYAPVISFESLLKIKHMIQVAL